VSELSVMGVMKAIVPITRFNKGEANRIFDEVESGGTKIVMKNNRPPGRYESLIEMLSDYMMQEEAEHRMAHYNPKESLSHEDMMKELDITAEELDGIEAEIE